MQQDHQAVSTVAATAVTTHVELIGGYLALGPGDAAMPELMAGDFAFDTPEMKPILRYQEEGERGRLDVLHVPWQASFGRVRNEWRMTLTPRLPQRLEVRIIASGEADLKLAGLDLEAVDVNLSQGTLKLDLAGAPWKKDLAIVAEVGTGQLHVRLPNDGDLPGVRIRARKAIGGLYADRLKQVKDGEWINERWTGEGVKLDLALGAGWGEVVVE